MKRLFAFALALPSGFLQAQPASLVAESSPAAIVVAQNAKPATPSTKPVDFHETAPEPRPATNALREAVDELPEADLKEFLNLLKEHYLAPDKLDDSAIARATVQGLLERFSPGVILPYGPAPEGAEQSPFKSDIIDGRIGYLRLGALAEDRLADLDAALKRFTAKQLPAAIVDLRATPSGSQFSIAAKICERFCPKGRVLFTIRKPSQQQEMILTSKQEPTFAGVLVTLVDADTAGAAEVISAVLRTQAKALVIGQQTRGEAVEYELVPLPSGRKLRVAVAEVALPENVLVFPGGVVPDIPVEVAEGETEKVLKAALESGVGPLIVETERPRLNEAALVAGTNPDLEAARAASANRGKKIEPILRDTVLQRALDAITTIAIFEQKPALKTGK